MAWGASCFSLVVGIMVYVADYKTESLVFFAIGSGGILLSLIQKKQNTSEE